MKRKRYELYFLCLCMICLCTACSRETGITEQSSSQEAVDTGTESKKETDISQEAPGGYVYDYQVSMEPIPKEIADLGGPCVGTMHAFPTRIEMALTQQEVEKDPELKAEVEKCTQEVKDALAKEVGGEFDVQIMSMDENKFEWEFLCKEVSTGYEFGLSYTNFRYADPESSVENHIFVSNYYDKLNSLEFSEDISKIVSTLYENSYNDIRYISEGKYIIVYITQLRDKDLNIAEEQIKILKLWEQLKKYNDQMVYTICLGFCPMKYEAVIKKKYEEGIYLDIDVYDGKKEEVDVLIKTKELYNYFSYNEIFDGKNSNNLEEQLKEYNNHRYDENQMWDYWMGGH